MTDGATKQAVNPACKLIIRAMAGYFVVVASYTSVVLFDNWRFWRGADDNQVGVVFDPGLIREAGIECPGPVAVRFDQEEEIARYRCSTTGIVIGAFSWRRPIVPWPAYTEGRSKELMDLMNASMANATHLPPS